MEEIRSICEALLILETSGDLITAQEKVIAVWKRISRYDQWYLMDIKVINVILYFFDNDVAVQVTDKLLERLKTYKNFGEAVRLSITLKINLSMIHIKSGFYVEALTNLERLLEQHLQELPYQSLAVCYNRMSICYSYSCNEKEVIYKQKIDDLLKIYEDKILFQMIQQEYKKYSNKKNLNCKLNLN
ncbi:hypothetical protein [Viridibacillus sp. FSL H8-0110]|uniref:hypothetical protein n=1 Tax=Viridibacillus sp. FSL H8-0110 TaxID=2921376 RepID=UPI0030FAB6F1